MPALNFQKQFADDVESGKKRQTIRAFRKDERDPKPGQTLYLFTGMRTKACRKLGEAGCLSADAIRIGIDGIVIHAGDGYSQMLAGADGCEEEARADGFATFAEMRDWFSSAYRLPFSGLVIRW